VQSVLAGTVAAAITDSFPYGNMVIVETPGQLLPPDLVALLGLAEGESLYHLYAHLLEAPPVVLGQRVEACQVIGAVGASGNTAAPHLHFETRRGLPGGRFPSMSAFVSSATQESRANYTLWRTSRQYLHFDPMILLSYGLGDS
jgi:murein DD-endopeptidase MepM/ murein hydrolase activator NlpD